jgi:ubiquinone/menaquinone biosynthesis C-methylase UbiE
VRSLHASGRRVAITDATHRFDDSAAYERFVGRWGRAAGAIFLAWLALPRGADWLDIGCGTGLFTELIVETQFPATLSGIDAAAPQIEHARRKRVARHASFQVGDAQALPFRDASFDVVASALVINFIPNRPGAVREMRRVARARGVVAGYVWDFAEELSPSGPFRLGVREVLADLPALPGTEDSRLGALHSLFQLAGLEEIATTTIEVAVSFPDFDAFWLAQTPSYSPTTRLIAAMTPRERAKLIESVRARLPIRKDGTIEYPARANAVRGRVPR